jgi:exosortase/archaeosortase family protein
MWTFALLVVLVLTTVPVAHAEYVYTYTGNPFTTWTGDHCLGTCALQLSFVFANPLPANLDHFIRPIEISSHWSDGLTTYDHIFGQAGFGHGELYLYATDAASLPIQWEFWDEGWKNSDGSDTHGFTTKNVGNSVGDFANRFWPDPAYSASNLDAAGTWHLATVPEPRVARAIQFRGFGLGLQAKLAAQLQHVTAIGATRILRVLHVPVRRDGLDLVLSSLTVRVIEPCAGVSTLWLMLGVAGLILAVQRDKNGILVVLLLVAAIGVALQANALRVAGIAIALEYLGTGLSLGAKEWIGTSTTALAIAQLAVLGRLAASSVE